jgi:hypothetical protein
MKFMAHGFILHQRNLSASDKIHADGSWAMYSSPIEEQTA